MSPRFESAGRRPAALSCSHPSGSGPRARGLSHTGRAPSRLRRDQNQSNQGQALKRAFGKKRGHVSTIERQSWRREVPPGRESHLPISQLGCRARTLSGVAAAPEGGFRPCFHSCSVRVETPRSLANALFPHLSGRAIYARERVREIRRFGQKHDGGGEQRTIRQQRTISYCFCFS